MADTQELSSTSHQAPLPPSGCFERGETLLVKCLYPEAKAFNGHCLACYVRRWHYSHQPRPKTGLWQLRQAIHYSIILNISGNRQDARAINISTVALQKEIAMHLAGIDQEGSRFTLSNKEKTYTIISLSDPTPPNESLNFHLEKKRKVRASEKHFIITFTFGGKSKETQKCIARTDSEIHRSWRWKCDVEHLSWCNTRQNHLSEAR